MSTQPQRISLWLPVASAALYSLAFPPCNVMLLVFAALVPWFQYLERATPKQAWRSGLLFGALFWLYQLCWFVPFVGRWTGSILLAVVPWILGSALVFWFFGFAGWIINRCFVNRQIWAIPLVWAGIEVVRSYMPFIAFPWGLLASPLWRVPVLGQHAALGTIFMVSAWIVAINLIVVNLLEKRHPRATLSASFLCILIGLFSVYRFANPQPGKAEQATIGQLGVDLAFGDPAERGPRSLPTIELMMIQAAQGGSKLLVMPEAVLRVAGQNVAGALPFVPPLPTLIGGIRLGNPASYQATFAFDSKWSYVDKTRLVIFGEYVPFREYIPFLSAFNLPAGDLVPGERIQLHDMSIGKIGPLLCFEALFPDVAIQQANLGAQLLCTMSNDDWYQGTIAPDQLFGGTAWRAMENGLPAMRVGSLGLSGAFDSRGRQIASVPPKESAAVAVTLAIPPGSDAFPYRWAFTWLALASVVFVWVSPLFARTRRKGADDGKLEP